MKPSLSKLSVLGRNKYPTHILGEYDDSLYVAPEFYSTENKLASPTATEQIYVYCLGMTIYSAAEFNCDEVCVSFIRIILEVSQ